MSDEPQEEDSDSNAVVAESALDRLACGLGGKTVFPQIMQITPNMLQQSDWKCRHAALMAISASGEGCHKQMEPFLDQVTLTFTTRCTDTDIVIFSGDGRSDELYQRSTSPSQICLL